MSNRYCFLLIILCQLIYNNVITAQSAKLSGIITLQNSETNQGKKILIGQVSISHYKATSTRTNSDGRFTLVFIDKKPGDSVNLKVTHDQYEVVNVLDLSTKIPSAQQAELNPIEISMCPKGEWQKNAIIFYGINEKLIIEKYDLQIIELKKENQLTKYQESILKNELNQQLEKLKEISNFLAKTNLDNANELLKLAYDKLYEGKLEEAINVLDMNILTENIVKAEKEKILYGKAIEKNIEAIKLSGDLNVINQNINAALDIYQYLFDLGYSDLSFRKKAINTMINYGYYKIASQWLKQSEAIFKDNNQYDEYILINVKINSFTLNNNDILKLYSQLEKSQINGNRSLNTQNELDLLYLQNQLILSASKGKRINRNYVKYQLNRKYNKFQKQLFQSWSDDTISFNIISGLLDYNEIFRDIKILNYYYPYFDLFNAINKILPFHWYIWPQMNFDKYPIISKKDLIRTINFCDKVSSEELLKGKEYLVSDLKILYNKSINNRDQVLKIVDKDIESLKSKPVITLDYYIKLHGRLVDKEYYCDVKDSAIRMQVFNDLIETIEKINPDTTSFLWLDWGKFGFFKNYKIILECDSIEFKTILDNVDSAFSAWLKPAYKLAHLNKAPIIDNYIIDMANYKVFMWEDIKFDIIDDYSAKNSCQYDEFELKDFYQRYIRDQKERIKINEIYSYSVSLSRNSNKKDIKKLNETESDYRDRFGEIN